MRRILALCAALACAPSCSDEVEMGSNQIGGASGGAADSGVPGSCEIATCQGHIYQCGDCLDNDGDGLSDAQDPECLGPCDNTEDSYYGGIPGQNNAPCRQDCYFDQDTGTGNDQCYWSHNCDPLSVPPLHSPSGDSKCAYDENVAIPGTDQTCAELEQAQTAACGDYCGPLTPNGCDCFGCCELPQGSGKYVWLGSVDSNVGSCDLASVDDPDKCRPCTPVPSCMNGCQECELCIGKTSLPDHCAEPDASTGQCAPGVQACGRPSQHACPAGTYCITGCCIAVPT